MMAADSVHLSSETMNDAFLEALAEKWRELRDRPVQLTGTTGFRPAREAQQLRMMTEAALATHMPADALARVWRSLCGDVAHAGGLKTVYMAGGDPLACLEAVRGYFGFGPQVAPLLGVREALERAETVPGTVACVPWPEQAGPGQWWPILNENRFASLRIVAGWPSLPGAPRELPRIAIVGRMNLEPSGDDDTFATAHDDQHDAPRQLADVGLEAEVVARVRSLALIRIAEFVGADDRRIEMARRAGLDGLRVIGVRPRP